LDYINEIRELGQKTFALGIKSHLNEHRQSMPFEPVATMQQVREFERDLCLQLPEPFVRYLTEIGNGGVGADYGIYSLDTIRERQTSTYLKTKDWKVMLDHSMSDAQWSAFAQKYVALDENYEFASDEDAEKIWNALYEMQLQMMAGGIFISTLGCTMNTILMCRGNATGEVFVLDWDYMGLVHSEPWCGGKFEDWMLRDLRRNLEKAGLH